MLAGRWTFLLIGLACMAQVRGQIVPESTPPPLPEIDQKIPGLDLMPPGSKLGNVSLPRYKGRELSLLVTSTLMTVVSSREVTGEQVLVYMYEPGKIKTTTMWMRDASYFFDTKILISHGETRISDRSFDAIGTGATYDTTLKKCFMKGPLETRFRSLKTHKKDAES